MIAQQKCSDLSCFVQEMASECHNHTDVCSALLIGYSGASQATAMATMPETMPENHPLCDFWHFGYCTIPLQRALIDCRMDMTCAGAIAKVIDCEKCMEPVIDFLNMMMTEPAMFNVPVDL